MKDIFIRIIQTLIDSNYIDRNFTGYVQFNIVDGKVANCHKHDVMKI